MVNESNLCTCLKSDMRIYKKVVKRTKIYWWYRVLSSRIKYSVFWKSILFKRMSFLASLKWQLRGFVFMKRICCGDTVLVLIMICCSVNSCELDPKSKRWQMWICLLLLTLFWNVIRLFVWRLQKKCHSLKKFKWRMQTKSVDILFSHLIVHEESCLSTGEPRNDLCIHAEAQTNQLFPQICTNKLMSTTQQIVCGNTDFLIIMSNMLQLQNIWKSICLVILLSDFGVRNCLNVYQCRTNFSLLFLLCF